MTRFHKALAVLFVASLGLWGCTQGPTNGAANAERLRTLESKNAKLEEDFRAAATIRDQLRRKVTEGDAERLQLAEQLQGLRKDKEELQQQVASRTNERNALQAQYEQFRLGLKDLLGRAEAKLNGQPDLPIPNTTAAISVTAEEAPQ